MYRLTRNVKEMNRMCCCMVIGKIYKREPVNLCCFRDRSMPQSV